jgi:hypothetical protein
MEASENVHLISEQAFNDDESPIWLLANSMELRPSWEVDRSSAVKEIPRILQNMKVRYRLNIPKQL